jgi:hypothetical protein
MSDELNIKSDYGNQKFYASWKSANELSYRYPNSRMISASKFTFCICTWHICAICTFAPCSHKLHKNFDLLPIPPSSSQCQSLGD